MAMIFAVPANALEIKGHKDRLFAWPPVLTSSDDGAFHVLDYNEMRDINSRDEVPERRARSRYVSLVSRKASRMSTLVAVGRSVEIGQSGDERNAALAVIFIHGRGGDRRLGMNDWTFGGNFNRLKNLAIVNGGVYVAPSVESFDAEGVADVRAVITHLRAASPRAPIILACASMGAAICSHLARSPEAVADLAGMVLLGGAPDAGLPQSTAVKASLPLVFVHGSQDTVYPWETQKAVFDRIRKGSKTYPARFVLFETGSHGTPIRMTDWKDVLSWVVGARAAR